MSNYALIFLLFSGFIFSCSSSEKQKQSGELYAEEVREFLQTLAFEKVDECYSGKQSWVQEALLKKSIDVEYKFSDDCKFSGKFTASYLDDVPMQLRAKDLGEFKSASALVKLRINQHRNGVIYGFTVKEGALLSKGKTLPFTARYAVDTDPLTSTIKPNTEKGEIVLLDPITKQPKQTFPFSFH